MRGFRWDRAATNRRGREGSGAIVQAGGGVTEDPGLAYVVFLIRQNRRVEAIRNLERMFKATPENRVVHRTALVAGYITANRQREAEDILNAAIKKNPNDLEALLQQSQIYIRKRRLKEALADLYVALTVSHPRLRRLIFCDRRFILMKGDEAKRREDSGSYAADGARFAFGAD